MRKQHRFRTLIGTLCLCLFLGELGMAVRAASAEERSRPYDRSDRNHGYNAEYIFAATYGLTDMQVPAALKVPLVPVTLVMDVVLLPFEVVAGCF